MDCSLWIVCLSIVIYATQSIVQSENLQLEDDDEEDEVEDKVE